MKKKMKWAGIIFGALVVLSMLFGNDSEGEQAKEEQVKIEQVEKEKEERDLELAKKKEEKEKQKAEEKRLKEEKEIKKAEERKIAVEEYAKTTNEMVDISEGVILAIGARDDDYAKMKMYVSDAWYYTPEHEKQRFADMMHQSLLVLGRQTKLIGDSEEMQLDMYDSYGEKVAHYSMWSGMQIDK